MKRTLSTLLILIGFMTGAAFAAINPVDRAELGVPKNYIANGGAERGIAGFSTYFDGQALSSITIASPAVFTTSSAHGLIVGDPVVLSTTGALPTGLAAATTYYVSVVGSSTTFQVSATRGGSSINTSGTQSGTHTFRNFIPLRGSGGTASHLTLGSSASSPLAGNRSLTLSNSGSTSALGEGVSYPFTIDATDKTSPLSISFRYTSTSGTFQSGSISGGTITDSDVEVYIYDVTNATVIQAAPYILSCGTVNNSQCIFTGSFLPTGSTSYRLLFHVATTNTSAWALKIDEIAVSRQISLQSPLVTDWVAYTPTVTGFGTVSNVFFYSRRVGKNLEVQGTFSAGTPTATQAQITLGYAGRNANVSIDSAQNSAGLVGVAISAFAGANNFGVYVLNPGNGSNYIGLGLQGSSNTAATLTNGNAVATTGNTMEVQFSVPIQGWSSTSSTSVEADMRSIGFRASGVNSSTLTSSLAAIPFTAVSDTHGAYSAPTYTVQIAGYYDISAQLNMAGSAVLNSAGTIQIYNATTSTSIATSSLTVYATTTAALFPQVKASAIYLPAGTQIQIRASYNATTPSINSGDGNIFSISHSPGAPVVAAGDSVYARYENTAGTTISSLATVPFATKTKDAGTVFNGSVFTAQVPGEYLIQYGLGTAGVTLSTTQTFSHGVYYNGSTLISSSLKNGNGGTSVNYRDIGGTSYYLKGGDTLEVKAASSVSTTLDTTAGVNWIAITRTGN